MSLRPPLRAGAGTAVGVETVLPIAAVFIIYLGYGAALPVLPDFLVELTGDRAQVAWHTGALTALFMAGLFVFAPLWGRVSDRVGRRPVLLLGLGGCVLSMLVFATAATLWSAYAARAVGGVFAAAVPPAAMAYVADVAPAAERPRRLAWIGAATTAGFLVGPVLGGWLPQLPAGTLAGALPVTRAGVPFLVTALLAAGLWLVIYRALPAAPGRTPEWAQVAKNAPDETPIGPYLFFAVVATLGLGGFEVGFTLLGIQAMDLTPTDIGNLFVVCSLSMLVVQIGLFARLRASLRFRQIAVGGFLAMVLGLAWAAMARDYAMLAVAVALVGVGSGALIPLLAAEVGALGQARQGRGQGRLVAASSLGQAMGSAGVGWAYGMPGLSPFWLLAGIAGVGLVAAMRLPGARPLRSATGREPGGGRRGWP